MAWLSLHKTGGKKGTMDKGSGEMSHSSQVVVEDWDSKQFYSFFLLPKLSKQGKDACSLRWEQDLADINKSQENTSLQVNTR